MGSQEFGADNAPLQSIVCVTVGIHLFSGRRKLSLKDMMKVDPSALPPEGLVGLGHKKICDPKALAPFTRIKREAQRLLLASGFRFLGGYGLPEDKLDEVKVELSRLQQEFDQLKSKFVADYERSVDEWVDQFPDWSVIIRESVPPVDKVADRLRFGFRVFRVAPAMTEDDSGAEGLMEGSYHTILHEVASEANAYWDNSLVGKFEVTQKAVRPVRSMREKLNGLAFVDARIAPVVDLIDETLAQLPKAGKFGGGALRELTGLALLLCDTDRMVEHGEVALGRVSPEAQAVNGEQSDLTDTSGVVVDLSVAAQAVRAHEMTTKDVSEDEPEEEVMDDDLVTPQKVVSGSGLFF